MIDAPSPASPSSPLPPQVAPSLAPPQPAPPAPTPAPAKPIPAFKGMPILGNFPEFANDRLDFLQTVFDACGDIGIFHIGSREIVLMASAELAQDVFITQAGKFEKSPMMQRLKPIIGNGLLSSANEFHKRQRKLVAPAFQHKRISQYADVMAQCAEAIVNAWQDDATLDIAKEMQRLTLWIVGKTLFGADLLAEAKELGEAVEQGLEFGNKQYVSLIHIPFDVPTPGNLAAGAALRTIDQAIYKMIAEHRAAGDTGDLLSMLLAAHDEDDGSFMTDAQVRDEVMTLFVAGHETTAIALAWAVHLLTQHPEQAAKLREESRRVLQGRTPTFADLPQLPYATWVFKESLRLYPPAYIITRQAAEDVTLVNGVTLPAGTTVMFSPYVLHRRADYFAEPTTFDPERFSPERIKAIQDDTYLPFGAGPRVCIGNQFALMEGQILLAAIAQRVAFEALADQDERKPGIQVVEPGPLVTLRPKHGIRVKLDKS